MEIDRTTAETDLVSVIIPTYNDDKFLPRAVNSIVDTQDYTPIEVVIVDSGDSNIACQLAQRHANVRQVHAPPEGPGAARNVGISESNGEYIAFLDADDEWLERKMSKQIERLRETGTGFSFTEEFVITEDGDKIRLTGISFPEGDPPHKHYFRSGTGIGSRTVVIRQEYLRDERFDEELQAREDPHLWTRILRKTEPSKVSEPLAIKHAREGSLTSDEKLVWKSERAEILDLTDRFEELKQYRDLRLQEADYRFGKRLLRDRRASRARSIFISSLRSYGVDARMLVLLTLTFVPYIQPELLSKLESLF